MMPAKQTVEELRQQIWELQGVRRQAAGHSMIGFPAIEQAFPQSTFPKAALHELVSYSLADAAATNGFLCALMAQLAPKNALTVWIGSRRSIFPPGLLQFGIVPERIVFIDVWKAKEALWAVEEALKCEGLAVVVGELSDLSFTDSRRLQLAVERSQATGLLHRHRPKSENVTACVSRWQVRSRISNLNSLPGVGFPSWHVQLQKVRNGQPGSWELEYVAGQLQLVPSIHQSSAAIGRQRTA